MSEVREELKEAVDVPNEVGAALAPPATSARWRSVSAVLAGALLLVVAVIATAPFWSGALPWAPPPSAAEPGARIDRLETELRQSRQQRQQDEATANAARQRLEQRLGALEAKGPEAPAAAMDQLERRVGALETRPSVSAGDIAGLRQQIAKVSANAAELAGRFDVVDKAVQSQATGNTDTAIVLVLLQIRDAVEVARPFVAEYEALLALARNRPDIAAAAAPLAEPAKSGMAGRAALADRLHELRNAITAAEAASQPNDPMARGWTGQALDRMSRLVQIRRIDDTGQAAPHGTTPAAVDIAARALAGGDLDAAVAALDKLTGAAAGAAGPWLRTARQRLAVEAALRHVEAALTERLGAAASHADAPGSAR